MKLTTIESRILRVKLSDEKKAILAEKIANLVLDNEKLEEQKKESNKEFNDEILANDKEINKLSHSVKDLMEEVEVSCYWVVNDPEPLQMTLYRADNNEVVETKGMNLYDEVEGRQQLPAHESNEGDTEAKILSGHIVPDFLEKLKKEYDNGKKFINCSSNDFLVIAAEFFEAELAKIITEETLTEYRSGDFILIEKGDYVEYKKLLMKCVKEYNEADSDIIEVPEEYQNVEE